VRALLFDNFVAGARQFDAVVRELRGVPAGSAEGTAFSPWSATLHFKRISSTTGSGGAVTSKSGFGWRPPVPLWLDARALLSQRKPTKKGTAMVSKFLNQRQHAYADVNAFLFTMFAQVRGLSCSSYTGFPSIGMRFVTNYSNSLQATLW
jgi:hypothetical protein